jgi:hypothetical protein
MNASKKSRESSLARAENRMLHRSSTRDGSSSLHRAVRRTLMPLLGMLVLVQPGCMCGCSRPVVSGRLPDEYGVSSRDEAVKSDIAATFASESHLPKMSEIQGGYQCPCHHCLRPD